MSLLYKDPKDVTTRMEINTSHKNNKQNLKLLFSADCGKFGTDEVLDEFELGTDELLDILQQHFNK